MVPAIILFALTCVLMLVFSKYRPCIALASAQGVIDAAAGLLGVDPTPLYFGLLSGATLGGNCTPIGASANIAGIGILRKAGCAVKNSDFFKIDIPAYIYLWPAYGI